MSKDIWTPPSVNVWDVDKVDVPSPPQRERVKLQRRASPTVVALRAACYRLGIETRTTAAEREDYWHDVARLKLPRKSAIKQARKAWRALAREKDSTSMMHAGHPARMLSTAQKDERTQQLFRAHEKRKATGWIRG